MFMCLISEMMCGENDVNFDYGNVAINLMN